jgi:hypothetical protein
VQKEPHTEKAATATRTDYQLRVDSSGCNFQAGSKEFLETFIIGILSTVHFRSKQFLLLTRFFVIVADRTFLTLSDWLLMIFLDHS